MWALDQQMPVTNPAEEGMMSQSKSRQSGDQSRQQGGQKGQQQWGNQIFVLVPIGLLGPMFQQAGGGYPTARQFMASAAGGFDQQSGQQRQRGGQASSKGQKQRNKQRSVTITGNPALIQSITASAKARGGQIS